MHELPTARLERLPARHETLPEVVERCLPERLRKASGELLLRRECVRKWLHLRTSARNDFAALDLEQSAAGHLGDVLVVFLAIFLILLIDVQQQFLQLVARQQVLVVKARAHAKVQRLLRLLLPRSFLEARTLASQAQLDDVLRVHVPRAVFDNALHVAALRTDQSARHLKLLVVRNLDVEAAGVFDGLIVDVRAEELVLSLVIPLGWHHERLGRELARRLEHVFRLEYRWQLLPLCGLLVMQLCFRLFRGLAVKSRVFFLFFGLQLSLCFGFGAVGGSDYALSALDGLLLAWDPLDQKVDIVLL